MNNQNEKGQLYYEGVSVGDHVKVKAGGGHHFTPETTVKVVEVNAEVYNNYVAYMCVSEVDFNNQGNPLEQILWAEDFEKVVVA